MAGLRLTRVTKRFGAVTAVDGVDIDIGNGEFLAVLGPSGCGKTTLLRLIAGFEAPDAGEIAIGDAVVAGRGRMVTPEDRRVGIVFQSYALWPHMTVRRNVGYALEVAAIRGAEYDRRVEAALASVGLQGLGDRRPAHLSGGQRQRVALARCLVMEPSLVLLDEPLANLDVHLRASMLDEFTAFHGKTGATMVYITHDQGEAMALADRIAVMDRGRVVQLAAPRALYREPATAMVGAFVGQGAVVPVHVRALNGDGRADVDLFGARARLRCRPGHAAGPAQACLRPEHLVVAGADAAGAIRARIARAVYKGGRVEVDVAPQAMPGCILRLMLPEDAAPQVGEIIGLVARDGWVLPEG